MAINQPIVPLTQPGAPPQELVLPTPRPIRRTNWLTAARGQGVIDLASSAFGSFVLLGILAAFIYLSWASREFHHYHSPFLRDMLEFFLDNPRAAVEAILESLALGISIALVATLVALLILFPRSYFALRRTERLLRRGKPARAVVTEVSGPPTRGDWKFDLEFYDDAGSRVQTWITGSSPRFSLGQVLTILYDPEDSNTWITYPASGYAVGRSVGT
jgi:hypothetical protein